MSQRRVLVVGRPIDLNVLLGIVIESAYLFTIPAVLFYFAWRMKVAPSLMERGIIANYHDPMLWYVLLTLGSIALLGNSMRFHKRLLMQAKTPANTFKKPMLLILGLKGILLVALFLVLFCAYFRVPDIAYEIMFGAYAVILAGDLYRKF